LREKLGSRYISEVQWAHDQQEHMVIWRIASLYVLIHSSQSLTTHQKKNLSWLGMGWALALLLLFFLSLER
jgi:hypothetical protein